MNRITPPPCIPATQPPYAYNVILQNATTHQPVAAHISLPVSVGEGFLPVSQKLIFKVESSVLVIWLSCSQIAWGTQESTFQMNKDRPRPKKRSVTSNLEWDTMLQHIHIHIYYLQETTRKGTGPTRLSVPLHRCLLGVQRRYLGWIRQKRNGCTQIWTIGNHTSALIRKHKHTYHAYSYIYYIMYAYHAYICNYVHYTTLLPTKIQSKKNYIKKQKYTQNYTARKNGRLSIANYLTTYALIYMIVYLVVHVLY